MKKLLLSIVLLFSVVSVVSAQKGAIWVGGDFNLHSTKEKGVSQKRLYNLSVLPEAGKMISDRIGLGVKIGFAHTEDMLTNVDNITGTVSYQKHKDNGIVVNPYMRVAILGGDMGSIFADSGLRYTFMKRDKVHEYEVGIRPGVSLNVSKNIALLGHFGFIGYRYEKTKYRGNRDEIIGDLGLDQFMIGINFIF